MAAAAERRFGVFSSHNARVTAASAVENFDTYYILLRIIIASPGVMGAEISRF
jgi:hypothetical protein